VAPLLANKANVDAAKNVSYCKNVTHIFSSINIDCGGVV
jgi:hypothetical protein